MTLTTVATVPVCECCALVIANGDDSGCRDYHRHTHPAPNVPAHTVLTDGGADQPAWEWTCEACGTPQARFAYRMWADVLAPKHRHGWDFARSAMWCDDCQTVTDYCAQN